MDTTMSDSTKVRKRTTKPRNSNANLTKSRTRSQLSDISGSTKNLLKDVDTDEAQSKKQNKQDPQENLYKDKPFVTKLPIKSKHNSAIIDYVLVPAVLIAIIMICYWNALNCGLVFDDSSAIVNNKDIRTSTPIRQIFLNDFWGTPISQEYSHKSYRPVTVLTFRLNYSMTGLDPFYMHLSNVIIYSIVCFLIYMLSRKFMSFQASFVTTIIFTTHPIHTEAVTGVVGRAELLMSMFSLLAFLTYYHVSQLEKTTISGYLYFMLCQVFICASFFSKEQGLAIVPILATYEIFIAKGLTFHEAINPIKLIKNLALGGNLRIATVVVAGFFFFAIRLYVMQGQLPKFTQFDNPASYEDFPTRHLTFNYLLALNFWLMIYPKDLLCDWSMGTIPLIESFQDTRNIFTLIFYLTTIFIIYCSCTCKHLSTRYVLMLGLSISIFTYLPASNLFVYVGFTIAERVLFMPSIGICIIFGYSYSRYIFRCHDEPNFSSTDSQAPGTTSNISSDSMQKILSHVILAILIILFGYRTHLRNYDWKDDLTLFQSGLQVTQKNAKLYNNIGHVHEQKGDFDKALDFYNQAADRQPDDIGSLMNVGRIYYSMEKFDDAKNYFSKAQQLLPQPKRGHTYYTRIAPNHLDVYLHLAEIEALNSSNYDSVVALLSQAIRMRPDYSKARLRLAKFYLDKKAFNKAKEVYQKALKYNPNDPDILYNLGVVSYHQNDFREALNLYEKALTVDPNHKWSRFTSSVVIQEQNYTEFFALAKERLLSLTEETNPHQISDLPLGAIYYNLAMITIENDDNFSESEGWFRKTLTVLPYHKNALFNLAFILNKLDKSDESLTYLDRLLSQYANHFKGHLLKASILHKNGLYEKAEKLYKKAEEINPNSSDVKLGLCHLYLNTKGHKHAEAKGCKIVAKSQSNSQGKQPT